MITYLEQVQDSGCYTNFGPLHQKLTSKLKELLEETAIEIKNNNFAQAAQILIRAKYYNKTLKDLKSKK